MSVIFADAADMRVATARWITVGGADTATINPISPPAGPPLNWSIGCFSSSNATSVFYETNIDRDSTPTTVEVTELYGQARIALISHPASTESILAFEGGGGTDGTHIGVNSSGQLTVMRGTTTLDTGTTSLDLWTVGTPNWWYVSWHIILGSSGVAEVRLCHNDDLHLWTDAVTEIDFAGDTQGSDTYFSRVSYTNATFADQCVYDDVVINDTNGSRNNSWVPNVKLERLFPSADIQAEFTRLSGTTNESMVDETVPDGDTTYNSETTVGDADLYEHTDSVFDNADGDTDFHRSVAFLMLSSYARETGLNASMVPNLQHNGNNYSVSDDYKAGFSTLYFVDKWIMEVDPTTGSPFFMPNFGDASGNPNAVYSGPQFATTSGSTLRVSTWSEIVGFADPDVSGAYWGIAAQVS